MLALLYFALQINFIVHSIRQQEKAGVWSGSKFVFLLGFMLLDWLLLLAPFYVVPPHSRYFTRLLVTGCVVAAFNFVWLIIVCRRWPLPHGRASPQAGYDDPPDA